MALRIVSPGTGFVTFILFLATMVMVVRTQNDIPDDVVIIDVKPVFLRGYDGVLRCEFKGEPRALFWLKGQDLATGTNLVTWYPPPKGLSGSGYVSGKYNLTKDFSLVVHDVSDEDAGRYICRLSDYRGYILRNYTEATVKVAPQVPFPTIDQCRSSSEATGNRENPCTLPVKAEVDATELTCRAQGATRGVISLSWTHKGKTIPSELEKIELEGETENVVTSIIARTSSDPYVCAAILPVTTRGEATISVIVESKSITTHEAVMTTNVIALVPKPGRNRAKVIIVSVFGVLIPTCLITIACLFLWRNRQCPSSNPERPTEHLSYFELWELVKKSNDLLFENVVKKLEGIPDREKEYVKSTTEKEEIYRVLCAWKESQSGDVRKLRGVIKEDVRELTCTSKDISLDDLEHICWHVHGCRDTVKPILRALSHKFKEDTCDPGNERNDVIKKDLQLMKAWANKPTIENLECQQPTDIDEQGERVKKSQATSSGPPLNQESDEDELTPMCSGETEKESNQMVRICKALEEAGNKTDGFDKQVYLQLSRTFFQIEDKYKSELTDKVLQDFSLHITERHCRKLGSLLPLSGKDIDARNEEDLIVMFQTNKMLRAWVQEQKCSNYEVRCRLRQAAEQCKRQDIADIFITKEQSKIMTSTMTPPASVSVTTEKQNNKGAGVSGCMKSRNVIQPQPSAENISSVTQPTTDMAKSEVNYVQAISRDELDRIGRYAGKEVLQKFCDYYHDNGAPRNLEAAEPSETDIIDMLKPMVDSEHDKHVKGGDTPRNILRKFLNDEHACLLEKGREDKIFNVEIVELAFRLIMSDIYPFGKSLEICDRELTRHRLEFGPQILQQGTGSMLLQIKTNGIFDIEERFSMVKALKKAGYHEEAKAIVFGFEISFGDEVEVEKQVHEEKLATQLGVSDGIKSLTRDYQAEGSKGHQAVNLIHSWKNIVHPSTLNHRLVLADALYNLGKKQLALDIISGKYRKRAIERPLSERLAKTIPEGSLGRLRKVLDRQVKEGQKCEDVIMAWVQDKIYFSKLRSKPLSLSNKLLDEGFYAFAHEIMAGAWQGKQEKKAEDEGKEAGTKTSNEDNLNHDGKSRKEEGKEEEKPIEKEKDGKTSLDNGDEELSQKTEKESSGQDLKDTESVAAEITSGTGNPGS